MSPAPVADRAGGRTLSAAAAQAYDDRCGKKQDSQGFSDVLELEA